MPRRHRNRTGNSLTPPRPLAIEAEAAGSGRLRARTESFLAEIHLDLLRLGLGTLGELDVQHTVQVGSTYAIGVHRVGQREGTQETTVWTFFAREVLFLLALIPLAFATRCHYK